MKTVGIITEYNPFHNGHAHQLAAAKRMTGADYCIVVMSGNFVQRGAPAFMDKYTRTQAALANGADLVLELPVCYALGSAEYFASGAVALLDKLGVTDALCFGSECGDITLLSEFAAKLSGEDDTFKKVLDNQLRRGLAYPSARNA
ncbi:MAG: nucleotidyltransferase family protein, partial [Lachnospiraceae bacterium]|nr:nucleotidyltransferase family protein [Lachnospiraceae bacterium]